MLRRPAAKPRPHACRRGFRRAGGVLVVLAAFVPLLLGSQPDAHATRPPFVNIWVPYWDTSAGSSSYGSVDDAQLYDEVSPFFLTAVADGTVIQVGGATEAKRFASSVATARARQLTVIPTVTDGAGKLGMQSILADPVRRAAHIANLVYIAVNGVSGIASSFDGIDLDYEVFAFTDGSSTWATTMPLWVQFVNELGAALHDKGKVLTITIPPVWNATTVGQQKDYWVYAQDQILPFIDRLRLMVYDWSPGTPSATAPITWVQQVVNYSNKVADATGQPRSKLELGVPAYGRHWRRSVGGAPCPDGTNLTTSSVTTSNAPGIANTAGATLQRDASGEVTFGWSQTFTGVHTFSTVQVPPLVLPTKTSPTISSADGGVPAVRLGPPPAEVTCTVQHTVFFPDGDSIVQKSNVALVSGWAGIIIWASSYESDSVYDALRTVT
ncbi:MAG: putative glycosidase [Ilumatobacteraceae bacterium]|nr:putative glycosidase [Ilumatobacteraceae bacterium]